MSAANMLIAVRTINDLLMAVQAAQAIVNSAAITGRPITDADLATLRSAADIAGQALDKAIDDAVARRAANSTT